MARIIYITNSYLPRLTGGTIARAGQVKALRLAGFKVVIVTAEPQNEASEDVIQIPITHNRKIFNIFQRLRIYDDELDPWVDKTIESCKDFIKPEDIIFAVSGGDLSSLKVGSLLASRYKLKSYCSLHDPINFMRIEGLAEDSRFFLHRNRTVLKILSTYTQVFTTNKKFLKYLSDFSFFKRQVPINNYLGFNNKVAIGETKSPSEYLNLAYGGNLGKNQSPEIFLKLLELENVKLHFIGDFSKNAILSKFSHPRLIKIMSLPQDEYLQYMLNTIDFGLVSLVNEYHSFCVPSKIYEYINLCLPILGLLPSGDASDIINQNGYGLATTPKDIQVIFDFLKNKSYDYQTLRNKISSERDMWLAENLFNSDILPIMKKNL